MKKEYKNLTLRVFIIGLLICLLLVPSVICAEEKTIKIGFVSQMLTDPYANAGRWAFVKEMEKLEKEGYKLEWYIDDANFNSIKQLEIVDTFVSIPVDIAVVEPVDETMSILVDKFYNAGIPVVNKNCDVLGGAFHPYVAMGNYECAAQAANTFIDVLEKTYGPTPEDWIKNGGKDGKGVIIHLAGVLASSIGKERYDACMSVWQPIVDKTPGLEIVTKPFDWKPEKAYMIVQDMWTLYGDEIIGIFAAGDSGLTGGAVPGLKSAGVFSKVGEPGHIPLVAIDGTAECLRMMREKEIDAVIVQDAFGEGRTVALVAKKLLKGESLDPPGSVLWEGLKPLVMELFPDEYGPEYKDAVELWAPVTVIEKPAGVHYKTNTGICTNWGIGIPPDSKLLWGNVMAFVETGKWPR